MAEISKDTTKKIFFVTIFAIILLVVAGGLFPHLWKKQTDLTVDTLPSGATIKFKGEVYQTPTRIENIKEGSYTVEISKEGYLDRKDKIDISHARKNKFLFRLYTQEVSPTAVQADLLQVAEHPDPIKTLISKLPYNSGHFLVEYKASIGEPAIVVSLLATLNREDQMESYKRELSQYKKEAALWFEKQGFDVQDLRVIWQPYSATDL